jgi:hypothetical protein
MIEPTPLLLIGLLLILLAVLLNRRRLSVADAVEDRPDLHAGRAHRPDRGLPRSQHRTRQGAQPVCSRQGRSQPEIVSRIAPDAARLHRNPLIDAAKPRGAVPLKKEI